MFCGIIEGTGVLRGRTERNESVHLEIQAQFDLADIAIGESLAVNGCCLTVTSRLGNTVWADLSAETLRVTTLNRLQPGDTVNLERSLRYGGRVGGHLVQGHVDGVGRVVEMIDHGNSREFVLEVPIPLTRYVIEKGSIAIDGVSLTIARCAGDRIHCCIIPHTEQVTTFQRLRVGDAVNLEVDMVGKYIEKLAFHATPAYQAATPGSGSAVPIRTAKSGAMRNRPLQGIRKKLGI
ncbi:MAG: riboflavin synthase [Deltaproteobacteria bacterium]|nr:riboflavin synthase [Deltaproteobacteria bacterium]